MDLVPRPGQVVTAAGNVVHALRRGGMADLRPMPRTLLVEGQGHEVHRYRPVGDERADAGGQGGQDGQDGPGDPVLLVAPLAAPSSCYDLRRGCSLVEHLVHEGRPTYVVEHGDVSLRDRTLGLDRWVDDVLPAAVREVSRDAGGRPVHLVGWSLGGLFALLAAEAEPDLPVASLAVLGTPLDVSQVPLVAPPRPLLDLAALAEPVTRASRALGVPTPPVAHWAQQLPGFQRLVTRPLAVANRLDDADFLAQLEAVDRFVASTTAYRGRTFGQLYHRFVPAGAVSGELEVGDRTISLADVTPPVLVLGGLADGIAPIPAVRAVVPLLTGSPEVRFEMVPGGHLGLLTGRAARDATWPVLDEWFGQWTGGSGVVAG